MIEEKNDEIKRRKITQRKEKKYIVSFPHIGNYYIPIYQILNHLIDHEKVEVMMPKEITSYTVMTGAKVSPDFACLPFKYNMGNYIEALENGANVLIQAGGGCRYGYYYEVQEQILKDMGYQFTLLPLVDESGVNIKKVYQKFKMLNENLSFQSFSYYFLLGFSMIYLLDNFETHMRHHFDRQENTMDYIKIQGSLQKDMFQIDCFADLWKWKKKYMTLLKQVPMKKEGKNTIKIGIVGELFTSMEPYPSFFLEKQLADMGCQIRRYTTVTYLLLQKNRNKKKVMKKASPYIRYHLGADGPETIAHTLELIEDGYDGIIHIKPFGCTPEINAMPILQKIGREKNIPIMYLTFDEQTSKTGIETRIEAFYDMLQMKKEHSLKGVSK